MRAIIGAVFLCLGCLLTAHAADDATLEYAFVIIESSEADQKKLKVEESRAKYSRCEFVEFDAASLQNLVQRIDDGELDVTGTYVSIRLFDGHLSTLQGVSSELGDMEEREGPYVWTGKSPEGAGFQATFVVGSGGHTTAYIQKSPGYKLSSLLTSSTHMLCERNPLHRPKSPS